MTMKRAVLYTRISKDSEGEGLGVARQETECRALAEREGLDIIQVFSDNDISAYSRKKRPGYEALCEALRRGDADVLVAWHPDRLTRHPRELEDLIDTLEGSKTKVRTVQAGEYDLTTPTGRQTARIVGAVARGESEHKSERLKSKVRQSALAGKPPGSALFGYTKDRKIVEHEAVVARKAVADLLAGKSTKSVAVYMAEATGRTWTPTMVKNYVRNAAIAGAREWHLKGKDREITKLNAWEAIVPLDDVMALRERFDRPTKAGRPAKHLLSGLMTCSECGATMVSQPRTDKSSYRCPQPGASSRPSCGRMRILGEPADWYVVSSTLLFWEPPAHASDGADSIEVRRLGLEEQRARLVSLVKDFGRDAEIDRQLEDVKRQLDALVPSERPAPVLVTGRTSEERLIAWELLDIDQQRLFLRDSIESLVCKPAVRGRNRFDENRIAIKFR